MMGLYLSHLRNRRRIRRAPRAGRELRARGDAAVHDRPVRAEPDGTVRLDAAQRPVETYTQRGCQPAWRRCSPAGAGPDPTQSSRASRGGNPACRSRDAADAGVPAVITDDRRKAFLGTTVPAQARRTPQTSLRCALDRLFAHPNVGPFIGKQLIQRLVTSNPSPAYVARVVGRLQRQRCRRARRHEGGASARSCSTRRRARAGRRDRATASCASRCCGSRTGCARSDARRPRVGI